MRLSASRCASTSSFGGCERMFRKIGALQYKKEVRSGRTVSSCLVLVVSGRHLFVLLRKHPCCCHTFRGCYFIFCAPLCAGVLPLSVLRAFRYFIVTSYSRIICPRIRCFFPVPGMFLSARVVDLSFGSVLLRYIVRIVASSLTPFSSKCFVRAASLATVGGVEVCGR